MKKKKLQVPRATLERLPLYYKILQNIETENAPKLAPNEILTVSTNELAEILKVKPEQIRKDLSLLGHFGIKGLGYEVSHLKNQLENILGLQNYWRLAIIGVGNLGAALANYEKIDEWGFVIAALFDIDEKKFGDEINGVRIYDFKKFLPISRRKLIDIGVIAVPDDAAQSVADTLIEAGVKGIWNFTATLIDAPEDVAVVNENLMVSLSALSFHLDQNS